MSKKQQKPLRLDFRELRFSSPGFYKRFLRRGYTQFRFPLFNSNKERQNEDALSL